MTSVQTGKLCWQPVMAVHLRVLLRGLGATICAQGRRFSRVLLLLLLAAVLRRRLWKAIKLLAMLCLARP